MESVSKKIEYGLLGGAIILLLALTIPLLGRHGLWTDEIFSVTAAANWHGLLEVFAKYENNMALYYILLCGWMSVGDSEFVVRLLSTIFAVLTIPIFHVLVRRLFDLRVAIIADFLLASNAMFLGQAREARSYSLLVLLSTLGSLLFISGMRNRNWLTWVGYALCMTAAIYAHYFAALVVMAHAVALGLPGRPSIPWRQGAVAGGLMGLLLLPLLLLPPAAKGQVDWIQPVDVAGVISTGIQFSGGRTTAYLFLIAIILGLWPMWSRRASRTAQDNWSMLFIWSWFVVPMTIAIGVSFTFKPIFVTKYLIEALPAFVVLVAVGLARLPNKWAGTVVIGFIALLVLNYSRRGIGNFEPWREVAQHVLAHAEPGDGVMCYPFFIARSFSYYNGHLSGNPQQLTPSPIASGPYHPGGGSFDPPPDLELVRQVAQSHKRIWVIYSTEGEQVLNRTWRPQITSAIAETCSEQAVTEFKAPEMWDVYTVVLYARTKEPNSSEQPATPIQ